MANTTVFGPESGIAVFITVTNPSQAVSRRCIGLCFLALTHMLLIPTLFRAADVYPASMCVSAPTISIRRADDLGDLMYVPPIRV
jgi:hypothetical protein